MLRKLLILTTLISPLLCGVMGEGISLPLDSAVSAAEVADLQETLENGLRARLPKDFAFIGVVVDMVKSDELPRKLVLSTYQWVRKKKSSKKYLVAYFEIALRYRAKKLGIEIPKV